jgi:hypothetical protein
MASWRSCGDEVFIDKSIELRGNGVAVDGLNEETVEMLTEAKRRCGSLVPNSLSDIDLQPADTDRLHVAE